MCDKGRHSKTVPFDKITDCDLVEPAGSVALCIPRVLLTVNVDTASSGGEGKRNELRIVGLKDAHKFKQLVWAMKRASRGGADFGGSADVYYTAPQALEMAERRPVSSQQGDGDKVEGLLRDIRDEMRENNQLLRDIKLKNDKNEPQQQQIVAAQEGALTATARATTALQTLEGQVTREIV